MKQVLLDKEIKLIAKPMKIVIVLINETKEYTKCLI